ncbi:MAG TPA: YtxH domain-containing protein [Abditibacteriaceae bacterium]|nr:YtxH domain-containing protein [Abditibacteriaceae bacterium]
MIFRKKRATPVEQFQRRVGDVAERVQDTWRHAPEKIEDLKATLRHTPEKIDDLRESAGHLKDSAGEAVARVREAVAQRASASGAAASEAVKSTTKSATETVQAAARRVQKSHVPEPVIVTDDRGSKLLWFAVGVLAGVVLGILLAPTTGRRSRALLKDKAVKGGSKAADLGAAATDKVADLGRRAKGVASELSGRLGDSDGGGDEADDTVIADRVRTALGQDPTTRDLERLNVSCVDGVITLHGPIVDEELQTAIEAVVRGVKGVREVQSQLLVEDAPEDSATFVG